jgi:competence protein ComFC
MPVEIKPRRLHGPWAAGFALDLHTRSSTFIGDDDRGHPRFHTVRSPIGELVYRLKYKHDSSTLNVIVESAIGFLADWGPQVDAIVPVPASNAARVVQPVIEIAKRISYRTGLPYCDLCLFKSNRTAQIKDVEISVRSDALSEVYAVDSKIIAARRLLLFDDLFDSGATASAITRVLLSPGGASAVYLLTLTQAR